MKPLQSKYKHWLFTCALAFAFAPALGCVQELPAEDESWEGLDADDIDLLEDENGVDYATEGSDLPPTIASAPNCVVKAGAWNDGIWRRTKAINKCGRTKRFRFIWRWAPDSPCYSVPSWYSQTDGVTRRWPTPYVTELRKC